MSLSYFYQRLLNNGNEPLLIQKIDHKNYIIDTRSVFTGRQHLLLYLLFFSFSLSLSSFSAVFVISNHIKSSTPNVRIMTDSEEIMAVSLISVFVNFRTVKEKLLIGFFSSHRSQYRYIYILSNRIT